MTGDDWKPFGALDDADADLGAAKRHLRSAHAHNDADAQEAIETLQDVAIQVDRAIDAIENPDE
jgi:hypothetical protein